MTGYLTRDRDGWTVMSPNGRVLYGPTWTMSDLAAWARARRVTVVHRPVEDN